MNLAREQMAPIPKPKPPLFQGDEVSLLLLLSLSPFYSLLSFSFLIFHSLYILSISCCLLPRRTLVLASYLLVENICLVDFLLLPTISELGSTGNDFVL